MTLQTLENEIWQVGILPETGSSTAFGRVRRNGQWIDVMRPTAESDYGNASLCASFIMLPWSNRLRAAHFRFNGTDYPLQPSDNDGTAIHGAVRRLPWKVESSNSTRLVTTFTSTDYEVVNFPFKFSARADFWLDGADFHMNLALKNEDTQPFPGGYGHHPYFVRDQGANLVQIEVPCDEYFELDAGMAFAQPLPQTPETDFRTLHPLPIELFQQLYTKRTSDVAARVVYPSVAVTMTADPIFHNVLLFAPEKPFYAVEPQTNANDGFNLLDKGVAGNGVFILQPGESSSGLVTLRVEGQ